jgi:membrane protease YdiL (CAAX protease family)
MSAGAVPPQQPDKVLSVDPSPAAVPLQPSTPVLAVPRFWRLPSWFAVLQAFVVSGIPTQVVVFIVLWLGFGLEPFENVNSLNISFEFIATLLLADTALIAILIRVFLILSGEDSRDVFLGRRKIGREIIGGLLIVPLVFAAITGIIMFFRFVAPWMHTVQENPMAAFMKTPFDAAIFLVVVVLAGGVREELQRGFILHRSSQIHFEIPVLGRKLHIGGVRQGLVLFSLTFGLLHIDQGLDVSVALALLGFFWGLLYLRRQSIVMSMTNHACFNAAQVAQVIIARSFGV